MPHTYQNLIFTNHAYNRLKERSISEDNVAMVIHRSDEKVSKADGKTKFIKTINDRLIHVVAEFLSSENKWLVISVWVRGEEDRVPLAWKVISWPFRTIWKLIRR